MLLHPSLQSQILEEAESSHSRSSIIQAKDEEGWHEASVNFPVVMEIGLWLKREGRLNLSFKMELIWELEKITGDIIAL